METEVKEKINGQSGSDKMVEWWFGTVAFAFFPLLLSVLISLCRYGSVDLNRIFGDGELILSAFSVATPTLIKSSQKHRIIFFLLLFNCFFQLAAYVTIKTNAQNSPAVVYISSAVFVVSSIVFSYIGEKLTEGRKST